MTATTTAMHSFASLNNEACSRILSGSCDNDGAIALLGAALSVIKNVVGEMRSTPHHDLRAGVGLLQQGGGTGVAGPGAPPAVGWAAFADTEARLRSSDATLRVPSEWHAQAQALAVPPQPASSTMRSIGIRPMLIPQRHDDVSLMTLSRIVLFNLALATHLRGLRLLTMPPPAEDPVEDPAVPPDGHHGHGRGRRRPP